MTGAIDEDQGAAGSSTIQLARLLHSAAGARARAFVGLEMLFSDPAWYMLLDLYIAAAEERAVTVSSALVAAHTPATTALRRLTVLEDIGLVRRSGDPADRRRSFLALSDEGAAMMEACLQRLGQ